MNLAIAFILLPLLGIYLAANSSFWIIPVGIVCMAIGYLYTGGPILFHGRHLVNYSPDYLWV